MSERRIDHRFDTQVNVISSDPDGLTFGFVRNLSKGGAFIEMKKSLPVGFPFTFTLAYENIRSQVFGRVVRVQQCPETKIIQGVAVRFSNHQGHDRYVRDDLLLYAMTKQYLQMWEQDQHQDQDPDTRFDQAVNQ